MMNIRKRVINIDIVRIIAFLSLISVHFFLNNNFYDEIIKDWKMYIAIFFRTISMICVPLFLIITGYLKNKKQLNKEYYKGIIKILINYVIAMIVVYIVKGIYNQENINIKSCISYILQFYGSAWYINMYIGLFMLIPFLNLIYWNLKSKSQKQMLIVTMIILTTLPSIINIYNFNSSNWFLQSKMSNGYTQIVPNWWISLYPLTYYFIGAYLSEYKINISRGKLYLILFAVLLCSTTFNFGRGYNAKFESGIYNTWGSVQNLLSSTLIFMIIINTNFEKMNKDVQKIITNIANFVFVGYMILQMYELIVYDFISKSNSTFFEKIYYYIPCVLILFIFTIVTSAIINYFSKYIIKIVENLYDKLIEKTLKNNYNIEGEK